MTCDERLEILLNRAGQTISDMPESDGKHLTYDRETRSGARKAAYDFAHQTGYIDVIDCLAMYEDYILHLTDIIDRMEWALDKVIRERDYLKRRLSCLYCKHFEKDTESEPCRLCVMTKDWRETKFELNEDKRIPPEDWRADR